MLKILVERGGDINIRDQDGETPLFVCEKLEIAHDLINQYNADTTVKNNDGLIAAQVIEANGEFPELAKYLYSFTDLEPKDVNTLPNDTKIEYAKLMTEQEMDEEAGQPLLDQKAKAEIDRILALRDTGVNVDDELRKILTGALSGHFERNVRPRSN